MNEQLTIVLTLKDRSPFTFRWMSYMNEMKCPYPILIADGGADREVEMNLTNKSNYCNLNYTYLRYPFDANLEIFYAKLKNVLSLIQTPYFILADNDDFFRLDEVQKFVDFLNINQDYTSCTGQWVALEVFDTNNKLSNETNGKYYKATKYSSDNSVINADSAERISYFFENVDDLGLYSLWYGVKRTSLLQVVNSLFDKYKFSEPISFELASILTFLVHGKNKMIDALYYIRQTGTSQTTESLEANLNPYERLIAERSFSEILSVLDELHPDLSYGQRLNIIRAFSKYSMRLAVANYKPNAKLKFSLWANILDMGVKYNSDFILRCVNYYLRLRRIRNISYIKLSSIERYIMTN
jgi:glycosyltransferase domain-containing protein